MAIYNDESINKIKKEFAIFQSDKTKNVEIIRLISMIVQTNDNTSQLYNFAYYGLLRRVQTLNRCVENIFGVRDFFSEKIPSNKELSDILINLQCFIINLYGALENLAWIYAICSNFDGDIHSKSFFAKKKKLLKTLPKNIRDLFISDGKWLNHIKVIRDLLVHQEPFYIPPYIVKMEHKEKWETLEQEKQCIERDFIEKLLEMHKTRRFSSSIPSIEELENELNKQQKIEDTKNEIISRINSEQSKYTMFNPVLIVNTSSKEPLVIQFYPQVLVDIKTLYEKIILILKYIVDEYIR